ncbi:MAG: phospho-sugar mutase [Clostridia bacterium]|nr:phospho-sugar mutase [Clostridia bacterium]
MDYRERYEEWLNNPNFGEEVKKELESIKNDEKEIEDRFYKDLEFGTAGLRGVIGYGTNRMNKYTVGKATLGLAEYIIKNNGQDRGVAIAYDCRHMSKEFSEEVALILNSKGIKTYIFEELAPTPELSFAVRELKCISGIVITASHNPPEYNGYKVYWEDGAQIISPIDRGIIDEVNKITDYSKITIMNKQEAEEKGLYNIIGKEMDDRYIEEIKKNILNLEAIKEQAEKLKIVYTPLHGTGGKLVTRVLSELGFKKVYTVEKQMLPDGDFPTVEYPNPEDPKAFKLAIELAKKVEADIILANDPDSDREGMFVRDNKGEYIRFNGNMTSLLIAEYIYSQMKQKNIMPENGAMIKTIVSSNLAEAIAKEYKLKLFKTLTGFKHMAKIMRENETSNKYKILFSYEESFGCIIGTHVRDKDGIVAIMSLCELAAFYKNKGISIYEQMQNIYQKYGYYLEDQYTITKKGAEGAIKIKETMEKIRSKLPKQIGKYNIISISDYEQMKYRNLKTGEEKATELPKSNVLYYELENDNWCCIRPSGTEPKIKMYFGIKADNYETAQKELEELKNAMIKITT